MPPTADKVLPRAVVLLREPIHEEMFDDFSYGFRPGRSPQQALETFWPEATGLGVRWVLEVDSRKYFDKVLGRKLDGHCAGYLGRLAWARANSRSSITNCCAAASALVSASPAHWPGRRKT
jgi:hypothetical protein